LYASLDKSTPSNRAIFVLQRLFLQVVDRRLQSLYRQYFAVHAPPAPARHAQKIASLEAVRADAQNIVDSYDWSWLVDWLELERVGETAESTVSRLSNFAFPIGRVNFRFTYHCNITCRHCYNSSGPRLKAQRIALEPMLAMVAQMPSVGIRHLNLTGGEPFLYPQHLTALIAAGRAAKLRGISICTNGYWALNAERTDRMLERLSAAGFMQGPDDHLKVSSGVYHQEFVAFDRVLTLAQLYYAMFGKSLRVDFELAPGRGLEASEQVQRQVTDAGLAERIHFTFRHVAPLGRGKELAGSARVPSTVPAIP
jgi:organic radical activating enzyme